MDYMKYIKYGAAVLVILVAGYLIGRYTTPAKEITKTQVVEKVVEKFIEKKDEKKHEDSTTKTIETKKPDGTVVKETVTTTKTDTNTSTDISLTKKSDKESSVTNIKLYNTNWRVNLFYKTPYNDLLNYNTKNFGVGVDYKVIGPFSVGVFGFLDKTVGLTLGIGL